MVLTLFAIIANFGIAQTPQKFSYQAVVRDASGNLIANKPVGLRVRILQKLPNGTEVFAESHKLQSNSHGLITAEVGGGAAIVGVFNRINWADGPFYIKTEIATLTTMRSRYRSKRGVCLCDVVTALPC